jgi:hypothetical protein
MGTFTSLEAGMLDGGCFSGSNLGIDCLVVIDTYHCIDPRASGIRVSEKRKEKQASWCSLREKRAIALRLSHHHHVAHA